MTNYIAEKPLTAETWTKKQSTLWAFPVEKLAPPPGVPAPGPIHRLPASIMETSTLVKGSGKLAQDMLPLVQWDKVPPLAATERTAWIALEKPVPVLSDVMPACRALKLKGVGLGGLFGALQPSSERYEDELSHGHIGFTRDVKFAVLHSSPAPTGAMLLNRAIAEFRNAEILTKAGCPSIVPIAVFRYQTLKCDWDNAASFGAVVCGGPTETRLRVSGLFVADPEEDTEHGIACNTLLKVFGPDRLDAIVKIAHQCGRTLRQFHEAGLYQYNGYPTNYIVDTNSRRVCLVDLDSSKPLSACDTGLRALEILRDVAGWLFNMGIAFMEPSVTARFPTSNLASGIHFQRIIEGYFADVNGITLDCIEPFLAHFYERHLQVYARRDEIAHTAEGEAILHKLWLNRAFCYTSCIAGLVNIYNQSGLAKSYPIGYTAREIRERAEMFLATNPHTNW